MTRKINRREFLSSTGALVVSTLLPGVPAIAATQSSRHALKPDQLSSYISINQDGSAVGWVGKVDMGQGTEIGWLMIIAEELDLLAPFGRTVTVEPGLAETPRRPT